MGSVKFFFDVTEEGDRPNRYKGESAYIGIGSTQNQAARDAISEFEKENPGADAN